MPKVPVYDDTQVRPEGLPIPAVRSYTEPEGGMAGLGRVIQRGAEIGATISGNETRKANQIAVDNATTEFESLVLVDTQSVKSSIGQQALKASDGVYDRWEKKRQEILGKLTNDQQRQSFQAATDKTFQRGYANIEGHVGEQIQVMDKASLAGRMTMAGVDLTQNVRTAKDVGYAQTVIDEVMPSVRERAAPFGPEAVKAAEVEARAKLWGQAIERLVVSPNPQHAMDVLETVKEQLGDYYPKMKEKVEREVGDVEAVQIGINSVRLDDDGLPDRQESVAALDAAQAAGKLPGRRYLEAMNVLNHRIDAALKGHHDTVGLFGEQALGAIINGDPARGIPPWSPPSIAVPAAVQKILRDPNVRGAVEVWRHLEAMYSQHVGQDRATANVATAEQTLAYAEFANDIVRNRARYASMSPGEFARRLMMPNPRDVTVPMVTPGQMAKLLEDFQAAGKPPTQGSPRVIGDHELVLESLNKFGLLPKPSAKVKPLDPKTWKPDSTSAAAYAEFTERLSSWKKANPQATDKEARDFLEETIKAEKLKVFEAQGIKGYLPGTNRYGFELSQRPDVQVDEYRAAGEGFNAADYADRRLGNPDTKFPGDAGTEKGPVQEAAQIPQKAVKPIFDAAKKKYGRDPTPDEMVRWYNANIERFK